MVGVEGSVDGLKFGPEKPVLAAGLSKLTGKIWTGGVIVLEVVEGNALKPLKTIDTKGGITSVSWLGKGDVLASAGDEGSISIWSLLQNKKEKPIRVMTGHDDIISSLDINPVDKETLISSSWDLR